MQQLWRVFGDLVPVMLVLVPLAALAVWGLATWRAHRMPRRGAWRLSLLDVGVVLAVLPVLYLVAVPIYGLDRSMSSLAPGAEMSKMLQGGTSGMSALAQVAGNLILFLPLGALVPLRVLRLRSIARVLLAAMLLSVAVETAQWVLQVGRVSATDDVILNTLGAVLGGWITRTWWRRPAPAIDREPETRVSSATGILFLGATTSEESYQPDSAGHGSGPAPLAAATGQLDGACATGGTVGADGTRSSQT